MLHIKIESNRGLEGALKLYKNKVIKTKQIQELRKRQEFVKPSVVKRTQRLRATYIQQIRNGLN